MNASTAATMTATAPAHDHPSTGLYFKIGITLFILTALEVALYEVTYGGHAGGQAGTIIAPLFIPLLLGLSAIKFALVAMFYMHLKQDDRLLTGIFVFPILIAIFIVGALMVLFAYMRGQHPTP
jgi:heme/copper-type cytochrome/quinol oxidase subunit 4